jgi:hypothetical protein
MKAIGIIQNHPPSADGPSDATLFFTGDEKRILVDLFGANEHPEVHIVEEHGGGEAYMGNTSTLRYEDAVKQKTEYYSIPLEKRIGRVAELLCDRENNLHGVIELNHENPRVHEIMGEIKKGAKYGLSIGVDAEKLPGGRVQNKRFTHVGLTKQPEYGGDPELTFDPAEPNLFGTWLHHAAVSHSGMDEILATRYLSRPGMYAPQRMRDRVTKRQAVPVSVGASRFDSASLIRPETAPAPVTSAPQKIAATVPMSNGLPSVEATMTSSIPGHFPGDPVTAAEQHQKQQMAERVRLAERELEGLISQRSQIEALDPADPSKYPQVKLIHEKMQQLFQEANVWNDPAKRSKYGALMFKVEDYVQKARVSFDEVIDATVEPESHRQALKKMADDVTQYGPVVLSIGASAKSLNNMRKAEEQLRTEREESKRKDEELKKRDEEIAALKKRAREYEENTEAIIGKRPAYSNTSLAPVTPLGRAPSAPEGVPVSAGASRFVGSQMTSKEHTIADAYYNDLAPRIDSFRNSPFARKVFNDDSEDVLRSVGELTKKYVSSAHVPFDGIIGSLK